MKIVLFGNLKGEDIKSMALYGNKLFNAMPENVVFFSPKVQFNYYIYKEIIYPFIAKKVAGNINHICDHSYAGLLRTLDPKNTIVTCHDLIPLQRKEESLWLGKKRFWFNVKCLTKAARIIAVSEYTKKTILEFFNYPEKNIKVIHYGLASCFKPLDKIRLRDNLLREYSGRKIILHVGTSYPRKNVELILKMLKSRLDVVLVKVGKLTDSQNDFIDKNNLKDRIRLFENIDNGNKLAELYNAADILIMPSFAEGFGLPVLEALACGLPVVCSDIEVFRELYSGSVEFADPYDSGKFLAKIKMLVENKSLREALIHKGIDRAKDFTWEKTAQETYAVYREVYQQFFG